MKDCPEAVIEAGRALLIARRTAMHLSMQVDDAVKLMTAAVPVMVEHGAKVMQMGDALARLRHAQSAFGEIMAAHESLRLVLVACDVAEPTDEQVASIR